MKLQKIQYILQEAIKELKQKDIFLLKNDISERAISYKLAVYLNDKFDGYSVDCEYNGYAKADNNKKYIMILRDKAESLSILRMSDGNDEVVKRYVYPDIIVHKRGESDNLLIIEVKKSTSRVGNNFDKEKVQRYTSPEYENDLNYTFGAFVFFQTGSEDTSHLIEWYENGSQIENE